MALKEAPEGIVAYSSSGNTSVTNLRADGDIRPLRGNQPLFNSKVNNGTIVYLDDKLYIDYSDGSGQNYKTTEKLVLSKSFIETLDLISEGVIEGPVSGEYIYSGTIGQTGWNSAVFSGYSTPTGYESSRWLRSIYWNQVPVLSDKAQFNFQSTDVTFVRGTPNGDNIETLVSEETTSRGIGERLRGGSDQAKFFRILNRNCKGIILNVKVSSLSDTNPENGDVGRVRLDWDISYRPIFSDVTKQSDFSQPYRETIFGKITSSAGYVRSTRVDFNVSSFFSKETVVTQATSPNPQTSTIITPNFVGNFLDNANFIGWEIKILRITTDSIHSLRQDSTYIDSITELYGNQFSFPNSAIVKSEFNAEFFTSVPERLFECRLLKVQIPGNYDPIRRNYSGAGFATTNGYWNGTFATGKQWTNNPAWCFYDILTNKRYGLGRYVDNLNIDKFTLYKIGQYCDELVYNADGGLEPRFTLNTLIASREDAFDVVHNIASVFRGLLYYADGTLFTVADAPKPTRVTFTNANVENGDFSYSSTSRKTRQSVAIVKYNNPNDFYKPAIEYVEDVDSIRRYGIRELDLTAFGCTSRGQAIRLGRWSLLTNNIENETIQFIGGLEATTLKPGDVFKVHDSNRKLKRYGGRVWNIVDSGSGAAVTLDNAATLTSGIEYKLSVLTPSYIYSNSQVTGLNAGDYQNINRPFLQNFIFSGQNSYVTGIRTVINLNTGFNTTDYVVSGNPIWSIELGPNSINYTGSRYFINTDSDYYRVINLKETESNKFEVLGLKYWEQKYAQIDSGIDFQRPSISYSNKFPATPTDLTLHVYDVNNTTNVSTNNQVIHYAFLVPSYNYINSYKVYATTGSFGSSVPGDDTLISILPSDVIQSIYRPTVSGQYNFRVYSYNDVDKLYSSSYAGASIDINQDISITNVIISSLQVLI